MLGVERGSVLDLYLALAIANWHITALQEAYDALEASMTEEIELEAEDAEVVEDPFEEMRVGNKWLVAMEATMAYAEGMRQRSQCDRAAHCAVLTDANLEVLAVGYNGPERGAPNECERPEEQGNCGCVHAEANALVKPQRHCDGSKVLFITCAPCERCAKLMVNAGVRMVVFVPGHRPYPDGIRVLGRAGILFGSPDAMARMLEEIQ